MNRYGGISMTALQLAEDEMARGSVTMLPARASFLSCVPLNVRDVSASILNIESKTRSNPLPWKGQFSPQFVQAILERYAEPGMNVCDPFLGSGTVLGESGRLNMSAVGAEINPAAYHMARIYRFINVLPESRKLIIQSISDSLRNAFPRSCHL